MSAQQQQKKQPNFFKDFMIGGTSAGFSKTVFAPIERVKLLLQLQDSVKDLKPEQRYNGIVDCFQRVHAEQGFRSFWRGNWANVVRYFPTQALNFAFKDSFKVIFCPYDPKTQPGMFFLGNCMAGGMAGSATLTLVYPLDFTRTRLGADIGKSEAEREFTGTVDCFRKIVAKDGVQGVYKGFALSCVGIFAYRAIYFGMFDAGKPYLFEDIKKASFFKMWVYAQTVTTIAGYVAYPLDTVRRRLMMQSGRTGADV
jgi:solute carrier family 25 (adenine nucleotide translocator) protein 4/5/6/31